MLADESTMAVRVTRNSRTMTRRLSKADVEAVVTDIVLATLGGDLEACSDFALGYCAALDMFAAGTLDIANPVGMVLAAKRDVDDVTRSRRMVTDFLPCACAAIELSRGVDEP